MCKCNLKLTATNYGGTRFDKVNFDYPDRSVKGHFIDRNLILNFDFILANEIMFSTIIFKIAQLSKMKALFSSDTKIKHLTGYGKIPPLEN